MTTVYEILERFNNYNPNVKLTPIQIQERVGGITLCTNSLNNINYGNN